MGGWEAYKNLTTRTRFFEMPLGRSLQTGKEHSNWYTISSDAGGWLQIMALTGLGSTDFFEKALPYKYQAAKSSFSNAISKLGGAS